MPVITEIEDLRRLFKRRAPRMFYDYCESGSWTEQTFRENTSDFDQIRLRQRVAVDMEGRATRSSMVGEEVAMPVALAPVGLTGMQHADGEMHAARAALAFGVPFTLSTMSVCSIEDVAEATGEPFWFQLYVMRDEEFTARIIQRAKDARCSALVLTLDLQILGQRHKDLKNGLSTPPKLTPATLLDLSMRWRWGMGMLRTKRRFLGNIVGHAKDVTDAGSLMKWTASQFDPKLDWDKVRRIKDQWGGKLILKGILDAEDALKAAEIGADAIVVSNHGGRQLDGAISSIRALPSIVDAVGGRTEIHLELGDPLGPGRAQGARDGRARHLHRPRLGLRARRHGRARGDDGARGHPARARHHHGAVRQARRGGSRPLGAAGAARLRGRVGGVRRHRPRGRGARGRRVGGAAPRSA